MLGKVFPNNRQIIAGINLAIRTDYVGRMYQPR
jgi:hypothetical protein